MKIAIGNQKGGVGKTTLCILLGNYLSFILDREVKSIDCDPQQSLFDKWIGEKELFPEANRYDVMRLADEYSKLIELLNIYPENKDILIDLPGYMLNNDNAGIIDHVDLLIIPFDYTELTVQSTLFYAKIAKGLNKDLKISFIPNRIKSNARYDLKQEVNKVLSNYGFVAPAIKDTIEYSRINTMGIPGSIKGQLLFSLSKVLEYVKGE